MDPESCQYACQHIVDALANIRQSIAVCGLALVLCLVGIRWAILDLRR